MTYDTKSDYDFETVVSHSFMGNMKEEMTPGEMKARGIVSLGGAEMDFATAPSVIDAIVRRAKNGLFGYTIADDSYLKPIVWWMRHMRNIDILPEWIVPTLGTIYSVATAIRLFCPPGSGIVTMTPVYYRYEQAAARLGRQTFHCPLVEQDGVYEIDFECLERLMAKEQCCLVILCNPHNPIGRVWNRRELTELARLSAKYEVPVFSDEIFAEITFDGRETIPYISIEEGRHLAITATSLGKTFNFTGVNQANLMIPDDRLREAFIRQRTADHFGSIDPLFHAAIGGAYCEDGAAWVKALKKHLDNNRRRLMQAFAPASRGSGVPGVRDKGVGSVARAPRGEQFSKFTGQAPGSGNPLDIGGVGCLSPIEGTFVAWIRWELPQMHGGKTLMGGETLMSGETLVGSETLMSGEALTGFLRREMLLDLGPGLEYGPDCGLYTRMNFATTTGQLEGALERIRQWREEFI